MAARISHKFNAWLVGGVQCVPSIRKARLAQVERHGSVAFTTTSFWHFMKGTHAGHYS
jgi:hypothetical protein